MKIEENLFIETAGFLLSNMTPDEISKLMEEVYYRWIVRKQDNLKKNGTPGDPRKIGEPYERAFDDVKRFYLLIAEWCLSK